MVKTQVDMKNCKPSNCKLNISLRIVLKCRYGFNKSDYNVYKEIINSKKDITMKELIEKVKKDRTSIQRTINKLLERGNIQKKQINLHKGFMYVYYIENKSKVVNELKAIVDENFSKLNKELDSINL